MEKLYNAREWEFKIVLPMWFFSRKMEGKMEYWVQKALTNVSDIVDTDGQVFSLTDIKDNLNVSCDFLSYIKQKRRVKQVPGIDAQYQPLKQFRQLPYVLHILELSTSGNKNVCYNSLERNTSCLNTSKDKCSQELNEEIHTEIVIKAFKNRIHRQCINTIVNISRSMEERLITYGFRKWELFLLIDVYTVLTT